MERNGFKLKLILRTVEGRTGVREITSETLSNNPDSDVGSCRWDRDGDDVTESARFEWYKPGDVNGSPDDVEEIDGDEWRALEDEGLPLTDLFKWLSHPDMDAGLLTCLDAARSGCDPDGWTDAHEHVLELEAQLAQLRDALCIATAQMRNLVNGYAVRDLHEAPADTMARLSRLVPGHEVRPL